MKQNAYNPL